MIASLIIKVTEYCNLSCRYCYMFNSHDNTYKQLPKQMPLETMFQILDRIAEYLQDSKQPLRVVLHGGEPTLWPFASFESFLQRWQLLRQTYPNLSLSLQTNFYEYNAALLRLFYQYGVSIGISLDGPQVVHDAQRVTHGGEGSYVQIMQNLKQLEADGFMQIFSGVLSVANHTIEPKRYWQWIQTLPKTNVSVLWPIHYNYDDAPPPNAYGKWYSELFTHWANADDPTIKIRYFNDAIKCSLGSSQHGDSVGAKGLHSIIINSAGAYERHDYIRYAADGRTRTRFNVFEHAFSEALEDEVIRQCLHLSEQLPAACETCRHKTVCGGGFVANRVSKSSSTLSRQSVMCEDHARFFDTVKTYLNEASI